MTRLSETVLIHEGAEISDSTFGRYTEVGTRCRISETEMGDYSYIERDGMVWCAKIGKFANIAASVRINATNHPMWRATLHHFTYRANDYWPDAEQEKDFFEWRRAHEVTIGHDTWLGHGVTVLPGVKIGNGAVIGSGAVVSKDVAPYTIVGGVPAKLIRKRFDDAIVERLEALAWWDWDHQHLRDALDDFRTLEIAAFLEKHNG